MTLKAGARNVDARRLVYLDEDTGAAIATDIYDASGSLWKFGHVMPNILPDLPCVVTHKSFAIYDLHERNYNVSDIPNSDGAQPAYKIVPEMPASFFTPGHLAASSGGF